MFKIGEFSKLMQVSIRMLRYYDETGLLRPYEIDQFSGYRLYSAKQIPLLNKILFLRDLGFNVHEIAIALNEPSDHHTLELLEQKKNEINRKIAAENDKLIKIELAKRDLSIKTIDMNYEIKLKQVPKYSVLSLRRIVEDYYAEGALWRELAAYAKQNKITISAQAFTIYHDTEYHEQGIDMEICVPASISSVDKFKNRDITFRTLEAVPHMAYRMVCGDFKNIAGAYRAFAQWLSKHNAYKMTGESRQVVHVGPWNEKDPNKYVTEIQIPLEKI